MNKPNLIIIKIDDSLHSFPITGNGTIMNPSMPFSSDYDIDECQIVFSNFDSKTNLSIEISRFSILKENQEPRKIFDVMQSGELQKIVNYLLEITNKPE